MSIFNDHPEKAEEKINPCPGVQRLLTARLTDLGGFGVRRLLPSPHQHMIGPWIFFDHFGPTAMPPHKGVDIRPHPHLNMATVTYIIEGGMLHQDSTGAVQTILPGAVNVMFAGKGIVHSERTPTNLRETGHTIQGLQLWLALPEEIEEDDPAFYHYGAEEVPTFSQGNVKGRVLMGQAYGIESPVKTFSQTLYVEATLPKGEVLKTPSGVSEAGIYVVSGAVSSGDTIITEGMMAVSNHTEGIVLTALEDAQIAIIGGEPLGLRYIWWNFVSSDMNRINQGAIDWEEGKFPIIPTDHDDYIPLPEHKV